ncbi:hypothetical protein FB451DRAFT_1553150 [Mycena latifolia]|nr:hypothetical protein FB451DRAFT_1553150 [Mycena latifolia]
MSSHSKPSDDPSYVESSQALPPGDLEPKVTIKAEPPSKIEAQCSSNSEIAMLKALLTQKSEEALKRELKLRTEILEAEKQNKRLKLKRAADATRIESLQAELARIKKVAVKDEQNDSQRMHSPNTTLTSNEVILIVDSEEEGDENEVASHVHSTPTEVQTATLAGSTSPVNDPPALSSSERPLREAWRSSTSDSSNRRTSAHQHDSNSDNTAMVVKDEIDVILKTEGEPDQFKRVTLTKSEDGNFDIWNVDGFGLGLTIEVDEKYNRGFSRKVIGDAFGGGPVDSRHHWRPKPRKERKTPFRTLSRSWNHALPARPGIHGMGFMDMSECPVKPQPVNFFVGEGKNDWRLLGTYNYTRWGEIAPHHISLLPRLVLDNWVTGMLEGQRGKSKIDRANANLEQARKIKFTSESVVKALHDGRLVIPFTILQCVGYPEDWFEKLIYYEEHPKPKAKESGKRRGPNAQGSPKKQAKTMQKGKQKGKREYDEEEDEDESDASRQIGKDSGDSDSEYLEVPREIVALPTRTSPRKLPRTKNVEL